MTKFCSNCGNTINQNDEFCGNCGKKQNEMYIESYVENKKKKMPIWLVVILVVIGLGIIGSIFMNDNNEYENTDITITFIVDGKHTKEITIPRGSLVEKPEDPSKEGYKFTHWATHEHSVDGSEIFDFNVAPTKSYWIFAHFEKIEEPKSIQPIRKGVYLEEGHRGYSDGYFYYIEGYIKNDSSYKYSYIQITFNTYDSEGNTLGTCLANNSGLEADGRWKFKAICTSNAKEIANYKFDEISKW